MTDSILRKIDRSVLVFVTADYFTIPRPTGEYSLFFIQLELIEGAKK